MSFSSTNRPAKEKDLESSGGGPATVDRVVYSKHKKEGAVPPSRNKIVAIIQARVGSQRFPGKVMQPILGCPMLSHVVRRVSCISGIQQILVATSNQPQDRPLADLCRSHGYLVFRGSHEDVLDRFYQAARFFQADAVVRVTADCPLLDPRLGSALLRLYGTGNYDHVAVATGAGALHLEEGRFPDGLDLECFSFQALEKAWNEASEPGDREHVTPFIWKNPKRFRLGQLVSKTDYSAHRWTVDYPLDFSMVAGVYEALYDEQEPFSMEDILELLGRCPELAKNHSLAADQAYQTVWQRDGAAPTRSLKP